MPNDYSLLGSKIILFISTMSDPPKDPTPVEEKAEVPKDKPVKGKKGRGKAAGKFAGISSDPNALSKGKGKKSEPPVKKPKIEQDPDKEKELSSERKLFRVEFDSGITLQQPVGKAVVYTSQGGNVAQVGAALHGARISVPN